MADQIIQYIICLLLRRWHELLVQKSDSLFRKAKSLFENKALFSTYYNKQPNLFVHPILPKVTKSLSILVMRAFDASMPFVPVLSNIGFAASMH